MTATPIPRSLTLTVYGDLDDLADRRDAPRTRQPVATEVVPAANARTIYRRLRAGLAAGAQAYVVVPLIEESDEITAASLAALGAKVRELPRPTSPSAVLHGKLPAVERERIMAGVRRGQDRGPDRHDRDRGRRRRADATWMVIESAERFGLAQLHQLRGRVGRGERASHLSGHSRTALGGGRASGSTSSPRPATASPSPRPTSRSAARATCSAPGSPVCRGLRVADLVAHRDLDRAGAPGCARDRRSRFDEPVAVCAALEASVRRASATAGEAFDGGLDRARPPRRQHPAAARPLGRRRTGPAARRGSARYAATTSGSRPRRRGRARAEDPLPADHPRSLPARRCATFGPDVVQLHESDGGARRSRAAFAARRDRPDRGAAAGQLRRGATRRAPARPRRSAILGEPGAVERRFRCAQGAAADPARPLDGARADLVLAPSSPPPRSCGATTACARSECFPTSRAALAVEP